MRISLNELRQIIREEVYRANRDRRLSEAPAALPASHYAPEDAPVAPHYAESDKPVQAADWIGELGGMKTVQKEAESGKLSANTVQTLASLGVKSPSPQFLDALIHAAKGGMLTKGEMSMLTKAGLEIPHGGMGLKIR